MKGSSLISAATTLVIIPKIFGAFTKKCCKMHPVASTRTSPYVTTREPSTDCREISDLGVLLDFVFTHCCNFG
jgi:hypothetical protein